MRCKVSRCARLTFENIHEQLSDYVPNRSTWKLLVAACYAASGHLQFSRATEALLEHLSYSDVAYIYSVTFKCAASTFSLSRKIALRTLSYNDWLKTKCKPMRVLKLFCVFLLIWIRIKTSTYITYLVRASGQTLVNKQRIILYHFCNSIYCF